MNCSFLTLKDHTALVWLLPIREDFDRVLRDDEVARAESFRSEDAKLRFIFARTLLRQVLGQYLSLPPFDVELVEGEFGKPQLASKHDSDLEFNVSHSGGMAGVAICRGAPVGLDLEEVDARSDVLGFAQAFLSERELEHVLSESQSFGTVLALRYWTAKEACLKALGVGMQIEPKLIEVDWVSDFSKAVFSYKGNDVQVANLEACALPLSEKLMVTAVVHQGIKVKFLNESYG